jgi:hypothetical protein
MTFCPGLPQRLGGITYCVDIRSQWDLKQSCSPRWELFNDMLHAACTRGNLVDSRLLVAGSQTANLTPGLSFGHNLCYICSNEQCKPILDIQNLIAFQWYKKTFQGKEFWPLQLRSEDLGVLSGFQLPTWEFTCECEGLFPHTFCTLGSMWSDSWVSLLARNLATPCLGREPKARIAIAMATSQLFYDFDNDRLWCSYLWGTCKNDLFCETLQNPF